MWKMSGKRVGQICNEKNEYHGKFHLFLDDLPDTLRLEKDNSDVDFYFLYTYNLLKSEARFCLTLRVGGAGISSSLHPPYFDIFWLDNYELLLFSGIQFKSVWFVSISILGSS